MQSRWTRILLSCAFGTVSAGVIGCGGKDDGERAAKPAPQPSPNPAPLPSPSRSVSTSSEAARWASEAEEQFREGDSQRRAGDDVGAVVSFRAALALWEKAADSGRNAARCRTEIAGLLVKMGRYREGVGEARKALEILERLPGTDREQAACRELIGPVLLTKSRERAEADASLRFPAGQTDMWLAMTRQLSEGHRLREQRKHEEAIKCYRATLALLIGMPDTETVQGSCHNLVAICLVSLGKYEEGIEEFRIALEVLARRPGTTLDQIETRLRLASAFFDLGLPEDARREEEALLKVLSAEPGMEQGQVLCHVNLGGALNMLGRYEEALVELEKATALCARYRYDVSEKGLAVACLGLGSTLAKLDRHADAIVQYRKALGIYGGLADVEEAEAGCHMMIAAALTRQGKPEEAIRELAIARVHLPAETLADVAAETEEAFGGAVHLKRALIHWAACIRSIESRRTLIRASEHQITWFERMSVAYEGMASLLLRMGRENVEIDAPDLATWGSGHEEIALHVADRGKGRTLLELVSTRALQTGDERSTALIAENRRLDGEVNDILRRRGPVAQPGKQEEFDELTRQIEERQTRRREIDAELRRTAAGQFIEPEQLKPAELCKALRPGEACLEYVACEKELLVFLATGKGVKAFRQEVVRDAPRPLREKGQPSIEKLVEAFRRAPGKPEAVGVEGLVWLQREWMDRWQKRTLTEGEHVGVSHALARLLLPEGLRGALAAENIKHLVLVPSRALAFTSFATLVMGPQQGDGPPKTLRDSRFLAEDYSVSYVQSLSLLGPIRKREGERRGKEPGERRFLAISDPIHDDTDPRAGGAQPKVQLARAELERAGADAVVRGLVRNVGIAPDARLTLQWPRLAETRGEAEAAAKEFGPCRVYEAPLLRLPEEPLAATVCVGYAANRPLATSQELSQYRDLLFGVHGHSDMANPWLSSLMLTDLAAEHGKRQPAPLTMADIFGLKLNAETVVLAACQTALGRMRAGEGVVGFQLAFLFAGADTVVLTQWEVPSEVEGEGGKEKVYPTTEVIVNFYRAMRAGGIGRSEALRQAQLKVLRRGGKFADPFYWGAWQAYGEWR